MDLYIQQLIEDLERVADNPPAMPYIEPPPHLEEESEIAELALIPFKSISEWTGLDPDIFPDFHRLTVLQCTKVTEAIFKVFQSLKIDVIDIPKDIPPEYLYEVLSTSFDLYVQYLPSSGFDLELCTGDPHTCPYMEGCDCGESFEDEDESPYSEEDFDGEVPF